MKTRDIVVGDKKRVLEETVGSSGQTGHPVRSKSGHLNWGSEMQNVAIPLAWLCSSIIKSDSMMSLSFDPRLDVHRGEAAVDQRWHLLGNTARATPSAAFPRRFSNIGIEILYCQMSQDLLMRSNINKLTRQCRVMNRTKPSMLDYVDSVKLHASVSGITYDVPQFHAEYISCISKLCVNFTSHRRQFVSSILANSSIPPEILARPT
jgi:hypothetical protein